MKKSKSKKIKITLAVIFSVSLISAITYLIIYFLNLNKDEQVYEEIRQEVISEEKTEEAPPINNAVIDKIKKMQQENSDVKAWIQIEGTNINYPLLQANDNDYYLTHNYKKQYASSGSIFINNNCNIKNQNSNVIIYGHYMKNGTMFADLWKYEKKDFYQKHPIVKITTDESEAEYEIIVAFKSRVFYQDEKNVFRFYKYYNFENEEQYNEYINNCKKIQFYDTEKQAQFGEQLITLVTCEYSQQNGRMVVVAKKLK